MDPEREDHSIDELKIMVKKSLTLAEENNRLLRSLRNSARIQSFLKLLYLVVIIAGIVWSYHFLQPYLHAMQDTYSSFQNFFPQ